jgi:hypothetical protein
MPTPLRRWKSERRLDAEQARAGPGRGRPVHLDDAQERHAGNHEVGGGADDHDEPRGSILDLPEIDTGGARDDRRRHRGEQVDGDDEEDPQPRQAQKGVSRPSGRGCFRIWT